MAGLTRVMLCGWVDLGLVISQVVHPSHPGVSPRALGGHRVAAALLSG